MSSHRSVFPMGSPPLARGTVHQQPPYCRAFGITPACAGNRPAGAETTPPWGDHPRLRGEQLYDALNPTVGWGSPPLARGTVKSLSQPFNICGITPACAGNRYSMGEAGSGNRDHPRLRGEQISIAHKSCCIVGSPPLARGTVHCLQYGIRHLRITPACAGNRPCTPIMRYTIRDHPRLRGEQLLCQPREKLLPGSPPLARGTG